MPTPYEVMCVVRAMAKPGLIDVLKRTGIAAIDHGFYVKKIESLGHRVLPDKLKKMDVLHTEGNYALFHVDGVAERVRDLNDHLNRDPDILKHLITKAESPVFFRQCTLHEESLPPPYREDVQAMIEKGFKDKPKVLQFDLGVDIYPFQR